jgi:hypothetical protein
MRISLISSAIAFVQIAALELRESCAVREKTLDVAWSQFSAETIAKFRDQEPDAVQLDETCVHTNVCSLLDEQAFDDYLCCLESAPDALDTLVKCEVHLHHCCDKTTQCCPGDTY